MNPTDPQAAAVKYEELLDQLTPELVGTFRRALERRRWPDGSPMSEEQQRHCMGAVIAWERRHLPEGQRVGHIERGNIPRAKGDD